MSNSGRRLLVTGREGQVVRALVERAPHHQTFEIITVGRPLLDLSAPETIGNIVAEIRPDIIVSAAAYTAVDKAEAEEKLATVINGVAAGEIARAAALLDVPVIHLSTDYVFDGTKSSPYVEEDPVAPLGAYGRSKWAGEKAVSNATANHAILRTAWVYSPFGNNFMKTMLRLAESREQISVVCDQFGNPTSAFDIADGILSVAENLLASGSPILRGTFHMTGTEEANWADFAEEIFQQSAAKGGPAALVDRITTDRYPTPARRPHNSRLDTTRLHDAHGVKLPSWRESLAQVLTWLKPRNRHNETSRSTT